MYKVAVWLLSAFGWLGGSPGDSLTVIYMPYEADRSALPQADVACEMIGADRFADVLGTQFGSQALQNSVAGSKQMVIYVCVELNRFSPEIVRSTFDRMRTNWHPGTRAIIYVMLIKRH